MQDEVLGGSWGEMNKWEYENRLQDDEAVVRESDCMKIKLVAKFENGDVRLSFEDIAREIYEEEFTPYMPPFLRAFFNNAFTYVVKWMLFCCFLVMLVTIVFWLCYFYMF